MGIPDLPEKDLLESYRAKPRKAIIKSYISVMREKAQYFRA